MLELAELSKIGFGCYRISRHAREHYQALSRALVCGCNLIDTAANYTNGDSEQVIGEVLAEHPEHDAFIITKAGYVQGEAATLHEELQRAGRACDGVVRTAGGWRLPRGARMAGAYGDYLLANPRATSRPGKR